MNCDYQWIATINDLRQSIVLQSQFGSMMTCLEHKNDFNFDSYVLSFAVKIVLLLTLLKVKAVWLYLDTSVCW